MASNLTLRTATRTLPPRNDEIDLRTVVGVLTDHKWLILIGTGLFFLASALYLLVATPRYEASAIIQVDQSPSPLPGLSALPGADMLPSQDSAAVTEIPLLASRQVLGDTVRKLSLDIEVEPVRLPVLGDFFARRFDPERDGPVASPKLGMSSFGWGGEGVAFDRLDVPQELISKPMQLTAGEGGTFTLSSEGRTLVQGRVGATMQGNGVTVKVRELRANPGMRFEVQRHDTLAVIEKLRSDIEIAEQGRDSGVISLRYAHANPLVAKKVLEEVTTTYVGHNQTRTSAEAAKRLAFVREQLPKVEKQLERAQAALTAFQSRTRTLDVATQNQSLMSQALALESSIAQLRVQQAEIAGRYTANHPTHRSILEQIGRFERQKAALEGRISRLPDTQEGLFRLTRDLEVINRTYANLLDQEQQLDIAQGSAVGTARIIDPADVRMDEPTNPKAIPVLAGGTSLGALLMMGFVLLRHTLRRGVEDPADLELIGVPVYASIPYSQRARAAMARPKGHSNLLALTAPHDIAMEALRGLRTNLLLARLKGGNNLLMVAAPSPGVGKTFVCANLAASIAQSGQRVLLVDADMRRGTLHEALGTRAENGLSDVLNGKLTLEEALRAVPGVENLTLLTRGEVPPNPSELLMNPNFEKMLKDVAPRFDVVLIDTPPVLAVTDAAVIGYHVGTTLMVARYGLSQQREVELAVQRLEQNGVEVAGAIFNGVENSKAAPYAYAHYEYQSAASRRRPLRALPASPHGGGTALAARTGR
ncbi:MAG TPA: polysaccharide biosynthesis tyrosine autokinase [Lysobacter sp.]|nr:polysaccharide biosynthesis tyrosine autokinase [Lysobacter sp.]